MSSAPADPSNALTRSAAHLPTLALIIGYLLFWIEMWIHPGPSTSWVSWIFLGAAAIPVLYRQMRPIEHQPLPKMEVLGWTALAGGAVILGLALAQSFLPPHLTQELDALNYHYTLARQHLILGGFRHLPWSAADLWPMPLQFGLAPYWFATSLPNKIPQMIFLIGLIAVAMRLVRRLSSCRSGPWVAAAAILGSHGMNIQFGSSMLDIPLTYLALAALDSWIDGNAMMGGIELAFYAWSKAFMPIQMASVFIVLLMVAWLSRRMGWRLALGFGETERWDFSWPITRSFLRSFALASLFIGGPFVAKSLIYAGTPLYPFYPLAWGGRLMKDPVVAEALRHAAALQLQIRNAYGEGRSLRALATHAWSVSVPSKGVNNAFDYPLGLPWLLFLGPFLVLQWRTLRERRVSVLGMAALTLWGLWWMGSQQSRWLYLPSLLMIIASCGVDRIAEDRVLHGCLVVALLLSALSLSRAYGPDLKHWPRPVLRAQDRALLERSRSIPAGRCLTVDDKEAAYSERAVSVEEKPSDWVLSHPAPRD